MTRAARIRFALIVPLVAVLFYLFVLRGAQFFLVPSNSMEPILTPGDRLVTLRQGRYERGDIVVVPDPAGGLLVKRIAGVPGDTIAVHDGALFLNGEYASEPYLKEAMYYTLEPPITVPEGRVFLLGDNRNASEDSHQRGETWAASGIVGKVVWRYYPFARAGKVPGFPLLPLSAY